MNMVTQAYSFTFLALSEHFCFHMVYCRIGLCPNFNPYLCKQPHVKIYHAERLIQFKLIVHTKKIMDYQFSILF